MFVYKHRYVFMCVFMYIHVFVCVCRPKDLGVTPQELSILFLLLLRHSLFLEPGACRVG